MNGQQVRYFSTTYYTYRCYYMPISSFVRFRFQKACTKYGVPDVDLFQTVDLFDRKNIAQVTMTIFAIGRTVR